LAENTGALLRWVRSYNAVDDHVVKSVFGVCGRDLQLRDVRLHDRSDSASFDALIRRLVFSRRTLKWP
jgi:hypothetical protein